MRSRIIVLLAVCFKVAAAGPLRHNGARLQHHNHARYLNSTELPSTPVDIQTLIPISISSSSITTSIAANSEAVALTAIPSTMPAATPLTPNVASGVKPAVPAVDAFSTSKPSQSLSTTATLPSTPSTIAASEHPDTGSGRAPVSTSALVDGGSLNADNHDAATMQPTETLSRLFNLASSPPIDLQPSTKAASLLSTPSPRLGASTSTVSDVQSTLSIPKATSIPSSVSLENQALSSAMPLSFSSTAAASQVSSSSAAPLLTSSPAAVSQPSSQVVVPVPISSGAVQVLGAGSDTVDEFSPVTLDQSSPAPTGTAKYPTAEGGNTAMAAGFNNVYKTLNEDTPCNPVDPNQAYACVDGEIAECQSDETYVLKSCPRGQSCYALPKPSGLTGIVVQCAVPSGAYSVLAGLSSSTAIAMAVSSQPAQVLQAEGDFSQATQSVRAQNPVQPVASSPTAQATTQSQRMVLTPSVFAATGTAQQVHNANPLNNSPVADATPSVTPTTTTDVEPTPSIPKALFAVITSPENNQIVPNGNSAQTSPPSPQASQPSPELSTPAMQYSAMSSPTSPDNIQLTGASATSTSTSDADDAGITSAPIGVPVNEKLAAGNGQATVTVTVTVTTTEKTPPITIISS